MLFSSFEFVLAFLPVVLAGYFILSGTKARRWQNIFLILASLFFYSYGGLDTLPILLASIAVNYLAAKRAGTSRAVFALGIVFNILLLGYFKYAGFFAENLGLLTGTDYSLGAIALPLGISFFTFQQISYLIAVRRAELRPDGFIDYCLYICFFPKLIMGPLAEPAALISQFSEDSRRRFDIDNFASGLFIFTMGLFKKLVLGDTIALFADNGFALTDPGLAASWITSLSYTLQIYFDFSGYSDMALGLARMLNIELPFNFLSPYKSASVSEFWRRWHITLGKSLSTYIYRPLGGSRCSLGRTCLNLFLTFMVSGLWHGAAWTFVLWGALHGLILVFERVFAKLLRHVPKLLRICGSFLAVNFLWVLFRAESFEQAKAIYFGMFSFDNIGFSQLAAIAFDGVINFPAIVDYAYIFALLGAAMFTVFFCPNSAKLLESFKPSKARLMAAVLMFCISLLCMTRESVFIYFNF